MLVPDSFCEPLHIRDFEYRKLDGSFRREELGVWHGNPKGFFHNGELYISLPN